MSEIIVGMGELAIAGDGETLSSLGLGSCVGLFLYDPHKRIGALAHIMLPDSSHAEMHEPSKKILIAEHDMAVRNSIKSILLRHSFEIVAESREKQETIQQYRTMSPSIALISAFLPPTNGADTVQELLDVDRDAKVIILSPDVNYDVLHTYLNKGVEEVITNPFTEDKVLGSVEFVLYRRMLKFANVAVPVMIRRLASVGVSPQGLVAKIVGGAHMFPSLRDEETMNIGARNVAAIKALLNQAGIKIIAEETGSNVGRTVHFNLSTGEGQLRTKDGTKGF